MSLNYGLSGLATLEDEAFALFAHKFLDTINSLQDVQLFVTGCTSSFGPSKPRKTLNLLVSALTLAHVGYIRGNALALSASTKSLNNIWSSACGTTPTTIA